MPKSIWDWLGIEPTTDKGQIKKAYAEQAKKYHPEEMPQEAAMLRDAYKQAMAESDFVGIDAAMLYVDVDEQSGEEPWCDNGYGRVSAEKAERISKLIDQLFVIYNNPQYRFFPQIWKMVFARHPMRADFRDCDVIARLLGAIEQMPFLYPQAARVIEKALFRYSGRSAKWKYLRDRWEELKRSIDREQMRRLITRRENLPRNTAGGTKAAAARELYGEKDFRASVYDFYRVWVISVMFIVGCAVFSLLFADVAPAGSSRTDGVGRHGESAGEYRPDMEYYIDIEVASIPDFEQLDLSEITKCDYVTDYKYDDADRLEVKTEFWWPAEAKHPNKHTETFYFYDERNRCIREETFYYFCTGLHKAEKDTFEYKVTKRGITEYCYNADGSCLKESIWGLDYSRTYTRTVYDAAGRLLEEVRGDSLNSRISGCYYDYNERGDLRGVARNIDNDVTNEITFDMLEAFADGSLNCAAIQYDYAQALSAEYRHDFYGREYIFYLDHYDENGNLTESCWHEDRNDLSEAYTVEELSDMSRPGYWAWYDGDRLVEEVVYEPVRDYDSDYIKRGYYFYDYNAAGNLTWSFDLFSYYNNITAHHYLYDKDGMLIRDARYSIEGDWEHTLYDGGRIEIARIGKGSVTDIYRYDKDGDMLHKLLFCVSDTTTERLEPVCITGRNGDISVEWQKTLGEYRDIYGDRGAFAALNVDGSELATKPAPPKEDGDGEFYIVQKGDCLWNIARKLLGDGRYYWKLYESNRDVLGEDPSLIYEGTELLY